MLADLRVERYELLGELATGGMATVYLGRLHGAVGFTRTVAIKSMHPQFAKDESFRAMFMDEATLTAKIRHPNVVPTLDVVFSANKLLLVMEFIEGAAFSNLMRTARDRGKPLSAAVCVAIVTDVLAGLHAAHELCDDDGTPLGVVHRDVSPHNVHVGTEGVTRVLDFGIAKAAGRRHHTRTGEVKGKLAYMAPEQLFGEAVDRRADVYATGVVLWEALTGRRLFDAQNEGALVLQVTEGRIDPPSLFADEAIPEKLDRAVLKALAKNPEDRWATAEEFSRAIVEALAPAHRSAVKDAVIAFGGENANIRARMKSGLTPTPGMLEPDARAVLDVLTQQVHVARTEPPPPPAPRGVGRYAGIAALVLVAVLGVGVTAVLMTRSRDATTTTTGGTMTAASAEVAGQALASAPTQTVAPPPPPVESASAVVAAVSATVVTKPRTKRSGPKSTGEAAPSHPPATPKPDCSPPYTVDAEGHRHYKAECVAPP